MRIVGVHHALMDYPTGVNALTKLGRGRLYKNPVAVEYTNRYAGVPVKGVGRIPGELHTRYGWGRYPRVKRRYWVLVEIAASTALFDVDAPLKLCLDTLQEALDINDTYFSCIPTVKIPVAKDDQHGLDVHVTVCEVANRQEAAMWSAKLSQARLAYSWLVDKVEH